ncbi:MAG: hypothetical protein M8467_18755 [Anaerolineae bacterium]|nr:hypothetical protein [Anaerolineae bacterium]
MDGYVNLDHVVRAWIMVQAGDSAPGLAAEIYGLNKELIWPKRHIIRADLVEADQGFNIMVPVWAEGSEDSEGRQAIKDIADMIRRLGAEAWIVWAVPGPEGHHPYPPHKAWGLVPGEEANPLARPMGFNAWG